MLKVVSAVQYHVAPSGPRWMAFTMTTVSGRLGQHAAVFVGFAAGGGGAVEDLVQLENVVAATRL